MTVRDKAARAAYQAYRVALVGRDRAGKSTAQQYMIQQYGAATLELPSNEWGKWVPGSQLSKAAGDRPLLTVIEDNSSMYRDDLYRKLRKHRFQIVELCRTNKMGNFPPDDFIANNGTIEELHQKLNQVLPADAKRAGRNYAEWEAIKDLPAY